ncbi:RND family efflux transporter, MFP subunit [Hydrocarboniphaga daqingensis]|uniref:RND family efflux transporter, MFP subunit n=1 Tax=Hydrocarboniphaga daqingensis TaxID=490188 RepID=A0A1M5MU25_9GAMM|nr:efflux RND transporter periplasmic adaptor subunit [Hydrocarboniphaga daqingensis]SHG80870.1 RND family efflux transporter, MFP subunit [Hydrocarboniphaga daqingensis]
MTVPASPLLSVRAYRARSSGHLAAVLLLLSACSKPDAPLAPPTPRIVQVATVSEGPAEPQIVASGLAASRDEVRLSFKVGGVVARIEVREGDLVKKGQRLAKIDTAEIDAQLQQAQAAATKAARDLDRGKLLFAQDVVTQEQLDDLGTAASVAQAQLNAVAFNREYAEIIAPDDGRVLRRLVEPLELVAAGTPVLIVGKQQGGMVLKVALPDRDALRLKINDPAEIVFDAIPSQRIPARVRQLSQAADARTGTYQAELSLDATALNRPLPSGLIGRATIRPSGAAGGTLTRMPLAALVEGDQHQARAYRFDATTSTVHGIEVSVAFIEGSDAALQQPLPAGTQLVTDGAAYLHDGEKVRLVARENHTP